MSIVPSGFFRCLNPRYKYVEETADGIKREK